MNETVQNQKQIVVFELDTKLYGVDIRQVKEITNIKDITPVPKAPEYLEGVTNLRGEVIAVIDLRKRLGFSPKQHDKYSRMIVIESEKGPVGMVVDLVSDVTMISNANIETTPDLVLNKKEDQRYLLGVGKKNGALVLLIDLQSIAIKGG